MVKKRNDDDSRGYVQKASEDGIGALDRKDVIDAASDASTILPGAIGDVAAAPLKALSGSMSSEADYAKYSKKLGRDLSSGANDPHNRALRRDLEEMDGRAGSNFGKYGSMGAGAIAGQAVGSAVLPIPIVGTVAGAWAGSSVAEGLYEEAVKTQDQDAVGLVTQLREMQKKTQQVKPELVFAALAANLPDRAENRVLDRLEGLAGTRKFSEAVEQGKTGALTRLMAEFDTDIRADTHMPFDPKNARKTASEQYAELINSRQMDARALLFRADMPSANTIVASQQSSVQQQPVQPAATVQQPTQRIAMRNPDFASIAADMNKMGITLAVDENGNLVTLPIKNKQPPGKA